MSSRPAPDLEHAANIRFDELVASHPVGVRVRLEWSTRMRTAAGRAFLRSGIIRLSVPLLTTVERAVQTVTHEYAHLLVFAKYGRKAKPHGAEWKATMLDLGAEPVRTHAYGGSDRPKARWIYRCTACGFEFGRARRLAKGREYRHIGCGGRIDPAAQPVQRTDE